MSNNPNSGGSRRSWPSKKSGDKKRDRDDKPPAQQMPPAQHMLPPRPQVPIPPATDLLWAMPPMAMSQMQQSLPQFGALPLSNMQATPLQQPGMQMAPFAEMSAGAMPSGGHAMAQAFAAGLQPLLPTQGYGNYSNKPADDKPSNKKERREVIIKDLDTNKVPLVVLTKAIQRAIHPNSMDSVEYINYPREDPNRKGHRRKHGYVTFNSEKLAQRAISGLNRLGINGIFALLSWKEFPPRSSHPSQESRGHGFGHQGSHGYHSVAGHGSADQGGYGYSSGSGHGYGYQTGQDYGSRESYGSQVGGVRPGPSTTPSPYSVQQAPSYYGSHGYGSQTGPSTAPSPYPIQQAPTYGSHGYGSQTGPSTAPSPYPVQQQAPAIDDDRSGSRGSEQLLAIDEDQSSQGSSKQPVRETVSDSASRASSQGSSQRSVKETASDNGSRDRGRKYKKW